MPLRLRVAVAVVVTLLATAYCYQHLVSWGAEAADFTWPLRGAREWVHGMNPYEDPDLGPAHPYPANARLRYPMPALLIALPFAGLPDELAGACFFGLSSGLLAFGLSRRGWAPLLTFTSATYYWAAGLIQWSPLMMAAVTVPWLYPVIVAKPNLGLPEAAAYPRWRGIAIGIAFVVLSIVVYPQWVIEWLRTPAEVGDNGAYVPPLLMLPGPILLVALLHWRLPSARLLAGVSIVPQLLSWSDQLLLFLIPQSGRQYLYLTATSWVCLGGWQLAGRLSIPGQPVHAAWFWVVLFYLSALPLVIAQGHGWAATGALKRVSLPGAPPWLARRFWWWVAESGDRPGEQVEVDREHAHVAQV